MKPIYIKRRTKIENRFSPKMGRLVTKVIYINKYIFGFPIKTVHKYRETYYGELKSCKDCNIYA